MDRLTSSPAKRLLLAALGLVAVVCGVAAGYVVAAGGSGSSTSSADVSASQLQVTGQSLAQATQGLCTTKTDIDTGDTAGARTVFLNQSHLFLHTLAAKVQEIDRGQAGTLLIAMYRVEDSLALPTGLGSAAAPSPVDVSPDVPQNVSTALATLITTVQQSAPTVGLTAPNC